MKSRNVWFIIAAATVCVAAVVTSGVLLVLKPQDGNGDSSSASASSAEEERAVATAVPTISVAPTMQPSDQPSFSPSSQPSATPSLYPSAAPSAKPSAAPSFGPSSPPTTIPSASPSVGPSLRPSFVPSAQPTGTASDAPSQEPTNIFSAAPTVVDSNAPTTGTTDSPTFSPLDPDRQFRIKMHWEADFFWQDEQQERRWCVTCCRCDELNFSEFPDDYNCESSYCEPEDQLWLRDCDDSYGAEFRAETYPDGVMLRIYESGRSSTSFGQCVTRVRRDFLNIQPCNADDITQKWKPISAEDPFALIPAYFNNNDDGVPYCITQHHHPKSYEILGMKNCPQAHVDNTGEWNVYDLAN